MGDSNSESIVGKISPEKQALAEDATKGVVGPAAKLILGHLAKPLLDGRTLDREEALVVLQAVGVGRMTAAAAGGRDERYWLFLHPDLLQDALLKEAGRPWIRLGEAIAELRELAERDAHDTLRGVSALRTFRGETDPVQGERR